MPKLVKFIFEFLLNYHNSQIADESFAYIDRY